MWGISVARILPDIIKAIGGLFTSAKTVTGDKSATEVAAANENAAVQEAFSKEFSYSAANRTALDAFVDGLNRLPRPIFALGTIALFVWCAIDPPAFAVAMTSMALIPEPLWSVLFLIIGFFFVNRTLEKVALPTTFRMPKYAEEIVRAELERRAREAEAAQQPSPALAPAPEPVRPPPATPAPAASPPAPMPTPIALPAPIEPVKPVARKYTGGVEELLRLAGYGPGTLHRTQGYTGDLPEKRGAWVNPITAAWKGKVPTT